MDDVALRDRRDGSVSALLIVGVRNMLLGGRICGKMVHMSGLLTFEMDAKASQRSRR